MGSQVFKVAKAMAPSVIYIDEAEKVITTARVAVVISQRLIWTMMALFGNVHQEGGILTSKWPSKDVHMDTEDALGDSVGDAERNVRMQVFIMDKRKAAEQGGTEPFNRIKRDLAAEITALSCKDRVLVIGTSSQPFNCKRKDEEALLRAFDKHIRVPLPDYASRQVKPCARRIVRASMRCMKAGKTVTAESVALASAASVRCSRQAQSLGTCMSCQVVCSCYSQDFGNPPGCSVITKVLVCYG
jgi:SpoVK/Ycf46/Vps4 family AAA+-type ATPase